MSYCEFCEEQVDVENCMHLLDVQDGKTFETRYAHLPCIAKAAGTGKEDEDVR